MTSSAVVVRERSTAFVPLDALAPEDLGRGAQVFDAWLRKISNNCLTADRLTTVIGSIPVVGNVMALGDALIDIVDLVGKHDRGEPLNVLDWASLGINLIGVVPAPGTSAARMSLRPVMHAIKSNFSKQALKGNISEALVTVLIGHLNDEIAGRFELFVQKAMTLMQGILNDCAKFVDLFCDSLIDLLQRLHDNQPLIDQRPPPAPPRHLRDPRTESTLDSVLAYLSEAARTVKQEAAEVAIDAANTGASAALYFLPDEAKQLLRLAVAQLQHLKGGFRGAVQRLCDPAVDKSLMWLLARLLEAITRRRKPGGNATVAAHQGSEHQANHQGRVQESTHQQVPARNDGNGCKQCQLPSATRGSISFAMGAERFTHTDFTLAAPLPIEWSRTYRSHLSAYDQGCLGARWLTPYTTRVDVEVEGRQRALVYHGEDGRSHRYPWLKVGQVHRDPVEEITLSRLSETLLVLDFGKPVPEGGSSPWRESYERVATGAGTAAAPGREHFRLVAVHNDQGASLGLRYDHRIGDVEVLSDIVSKQGEQVIAHVGVQPEAETGRIRALWEIRDGQLLRQLAAYDYDAAGDLVQAQDENAAAWRYEYQHHLVTRYTDRTGRGMNLRYDGSGDRAKAVHEWADDGSFEVRLAWDPDLRLTTVTDALGQTSEHYYDIDGYTYRIIHADGLEEWFFRDAAKNITRHVHPDGSTDDYRYDAHGNLLQHVRRDGSRVHFEYDEAHRLTGVLDPDGGVWKREYDRQGRLIEEIDPLGHKTEYAYDAAGRVSKVTDAKGGVKKLAYTASGQLARYTDCSGCTTQWDYDERGRLVKTTDALGHATEYRYTAITAAALQATQHATEPGNHPGQLAAVRHPDGSEEQLCHDAEGRLLSHTDALQRTTAYRYTAAGLIEQRRDAAGHRLQYRWDRLGRLTELRNENDQPYRFRYDPVGRLLAETGFDGQATEYRYEDSTGVLLEMRDGGVTTALEFDAMGRLLKRSATAPGGEAQTETFGYYPGGQIAEARNEHARLQWFYDVAGNLVREHHHYQGPFFPEKKTAVWRHRYNELNQRVGTTRPDGHTVEWLTYGSGHIHGLVLDGRDVLGFERDELHREVYRRQGNDLEQHQKYDPAGRLLEQQVKYRHQRSPVDISQAYQYASTSIGAQATILRRYSYDKVGQLDHIEDSRRGRLEYRYDPVGRLLQATSALAKETFAFDPAGNILPAEDRESSPIPARQALPKVLDNLLKEYAGTTYTHDERGNLTEQLRNGHRSVFEWDAFSRMTKAVTPYGTAQFAYDPLGRRIAKHSLRATTQAGDPQREEVLFGWDGDTLAFESRTQHGARQTGRQTAHYIHEPGGFVPLLQTRRKESIRLAPTTDVKALMASNGGHYAAELDPLWNGEADPEAAPFTSEEIAFYQCDHLGTPQELTDHNGKIAWAAQYKAWGQAKEAISGAAIKAGFTNPIRFQGQYFDEETGLHYNRYRYYDPFAGRYLSRDPVGLAGGVNLHEYAPNPLGWIDPWGLQRRKKSDPAPTLTHQPCCKCKGDYAYRVLRSDEDPSAGLAPKDPTANYTPEGHVGHGSRPEFRSQYISASRTYEQAVSNSQRYGTGRERIVRIDLSQVHDAIDLNSECSPLKGISARRFAGRSGEVLIVGSVPPSAIKIVRP
ncbi:RHS repeat-associated core domain-containing protein [Eleftheria terrae]|uniref:RHS repeat-associated core domain-containing protein n=1 Tax=Eleftheria terrae TaxID=1597781 RepID=UPI00263B3BD5|nr:RHS repeat-associated core domain-containing protein [Eleftheria terrae]WKB54340.1 RHS domain-containing protein [Eleftheria terrae]